MQFNDSLKNEIENRWLVVFFRYFVSGKIESLHYLDTFKVSTCKKWTYCKNQQWQCHSIMRSRKVLEPQKDHGHKKLYVILFNVINRVFFLHHLHNIFDRKYFLQFSGEPPWHTFFILMVQYMNFEYRIPQRKAFWSSKCK